MLRLISGFRRFKEKYFLEEKSLYQNLATQQAPKTIIIGCSDSRVDPAILSDASPGEIFVVRNVANLVPPYDTSVGFHGVSAAIEFAVVNLQVENIIVLGHRQCGGIRALVQGNTSSNSFFVTQWMSIAARARKHVMDKFSGEDLETLCHQCELESIKCSLENLKTFPFVQSALAEKKLSILGIYFDLEKGELLEFDQDSSSFKKIDT